MIQDPDCSEIWTDPRFILLDLHSSVDGRYRVAMSQGFAGVTNVQVGLEVVLSETFWNQLLFLLRAFHEVAQPQVAVRAVMV